MHLKKINQWQNLGNDRKKRLLDWIARYHFVVTYHQSPMEIARDFGLFVWMIAALCASLATGSMVGVIVSTPLKTYHLAMWIFLGAAFTWITSSFVGGAVAQFLLGALLMNQYFLFGLLTALLSIFASYLLVRLDQNHRALRWSILGALSAWCVGTIGTAIAYNRFMEHAAATTAALPTNFWACIMFSMAITTILGACIGGMVFRHRQIWRGL
jgi:hypothetical protein